MSASLSFPVATGRLVVSRQELVALAEEVGAHRVRSLDGAGLLHIGVDSGAAQAALEARSLGRAHAGLLGSEAAWVRQRLARLRLDRPGDRAVLVLRHHRDRLESHLLAAGEGVGAAVTATFDRPVTVGPISTVVADEFVIEELDPAGLRARAWRCAGLAPPDRPGPPDPPRAGTAARLPHRLLAGLRDQVRASAEVAVSQLVAAGLAAGDAEDLVADVAAGPLPLVRLVAWWRDGHGGVRESAAGWMVGSRRVWLLDDRADPGSIGIGPASPADAAAQVAASLEEVWG